MSQFSRIGRTYARYAELLNLRSARNLVNAGWGFGKAGGTMSGIRGAGAGAKAWLMGGNVSERVARMSTLGVAGKIGLGGMGAGIGINSRRDRRER